VQTNDRLRLVDAKPIIEVENFRAAYGPKTIVQNLNFNIKRGEVFVIAGGSGCGKSTVLKHMIGLKAPATGRILLDGEDLAASTGVVRQKILRKFGVAFQSGALFGDMTVLQNVGLPLMEYTDLSTDAIEMIALTKLRLVDLEHATQKLPSELSGGMQKRAAIARAMALDPAIVFLDEPSAGLDPITSADLDELIVDLNRMLNMTFVVVTHELPSIFRIADRVIVLDAAVKTMVALDDPATLRDSSPNPWVRQFFSREASTVADPAAARSPQTATASARGGT
jgi:phospholipid/cholesterol/gamma-HCH transport system ATP-binding protein